MSNAPTISQDPNEFLMGGGVPSASFQAIGAAIAGVICEPPPFLQQQRDYTTNEPKVWDDGNPMMHLVVTLQTDEIDPAIEDDDGRRRIYVKNNMRRAVADAVRKGKAKQLEVGGHLSVTYTANGEPTKKGMQAPKLYEAIYSPPGTSFLSNGRDEDTPASNSKPNGIVNMDGWAWSDGVRYATQNGITEANFKAELQKHGLKKFDIAAKKVLAEMVTQMNGPLTEDDIPF